LGFAADCDQPRIPAQVVLSPKKALSRVENSGGDRSSSTIHTTVTKAKSPPLLNNTIKHDYYPLIIMVKHLESMDDFNTMLETSKTKLVVVDFTATWCGPCKYIGPIFEKLAEENPDIEFVKVDVDEADDVAAHCGVRAMPTFQFFRNGEKIEEMMGADQNKLAALVAKLK
jgi:thioredoxin 1